MRLPDQFVAAIFRDLDEFLVDREDIALRVRVGDDAGHIHDIGAQFQLERILRELVDERGDIDARSDKAGGLALRIGNGRITHLEPDLAGIAAGQAQGSGLRLTAREPIPEGTVGGGLTLLLGHEA